MFKTKLRASIQTNCKENRLEIVRTVRGQTLGRTEEPQRVIPWNCVRVGTEVCISVEGGVTMQASIA